MGDALHYLYAVDFEHPSDLQNSLLAKADSFKDDCVSQKQLLKGFHWEPDRQGFTIEVDTTDSATPFDGVVLRKLSQAASSFRAG